MAEEYITFPKTFEKYKWYKPILVFILGIIIMLIFEVILSVIFSAVYGDNFIDSIINGGYEVLNTEVGEIFTDLVVIVMIPSLYLATKIVRDRPFSSYSSSRGGWNYRLYFKALIIPLIAYIILNAADTLINGANGTYHFSIVFLIISIICVPLQCIAEEYVYRGLIMQTFGAWFKIPVVAIVLQGIIFTISHGYTPIGLVEILVFGILMGVLTLKTNGIEVSSAMHTANNFSISLFVMFGLQSSTSSPQLTDVVISIVFEIILFAIIYYTGQKSNWYGEIPENA